MRKNKKYLKTKLKLLFIILVAILLFIYFKKNIKNIDNKNTNNNTPTTIVETYEYQNNIINNTDKELDEDIKKLLIDFFNLYYRSMKELNSYDMTKFFSNDNEALLNQTTLEVLIESRKQTLNDLSLNKAMYDLTINKITNKDDSIYIELNEDSYIDFKFLNFTSKVYNILNTFDIVKVENEYKIKTHYKEQGHFIMVNRLLDKSKNYTEQLTKIKNNYNDLFIKAKEEQNNLYDEYISNKNKTFKTCDHSYDREKATSYALKYVKQRNQDVPNYDDDGNCQNYASWVIHNGGVPMDNKGTYTWKNINGDKTATWTAVGYFYNYAKNNNGYGLCSEVDVNPYYAQKGDIVQVGYDNKYRHTAVVIDTFKKDNNVIDVILSSNTGDLEYYPLSAYSYPEKRLIKILGWND